MALTLTVLYFQNRTETYLLDWSLLGVGFFVSNVLGALGFYVALPSFVVPGIANASFVTAQAAICTGLLAFLGRPPRRYLLVVTFFLVLGLGLIPSVAANFGARAMLFYPIIALSSLIAMNICIKAKDTELGKALLLIFGVELVYLVTTIARGLMIVFDASPNSFLGNDFSQTTGTLQILLFLFLMCLAFVLTVSWKKELRLRKHAITDPLTGWRNRRTLDATAQGLFAKAMRHHRSFGFVTFDIDHFKRFNDEFGHKAGDRVLQHMCQRIEANHREWDLCYRIGGEEFCILVEECHQQDLALIAERVLHTVANSPIEIQGHSHAITISVGTALYECTDLCWQDTLERADKALYGAKKAGRNCVVHAPSPIQQESSQLTVPEPRYTATPNSQVKLEV